MYTPIKNSIEAWYRTTRYRLGQVRQQLGFVEPLTLEDRREVQLQLPASALSLFNTMSNADQQHSLRVCRGLQAQGCVEPDMLAAALLHDVGKAQGRVPFWTRPVIVIGKLCAPNLLARIVLPLAPVGTDVSRPRPQSTSDENVMINRNKLSWIRHAICRGLNSLRPRPNDQRQRGRNELRPLQPTYPSFVKLHNWSLQGALSSNHNKFPSWRRALSYAWWHADIGADLAAQAGLSEQAELYIRTHHEPHGPAAALHRVDEVS